MTNSMNNDIIYGNEYPGKLYNKFSEYLKSKYGQKVYKLPINIPSTCPNRDGKLGGSGCIFCGEEGAGFECLPADMEVKSQIIKNAEYIGNGYKAEKFIAYFQNYSNTYLPFDLFKKYITDACIENIVGIYISTRPDCINTKYLEFLQDIKSKAGVDIVLEIGLQTVNYHTLEQLGRGHGLAEFIDAAVNIKSYGLDVCAHYIVDLPMDSEKDVAEGARIISALKVDQVKCHSLYILKGTPLEKLYNEGKIVPVSMEEYIKRIITFLEYLNPDIVIQRLLGRSPEERSAFCSWGVSWRKIVGIVEKEMIRMNTYQGRKFNYLNGGRCFEGLL